MALQTANTSSPRRVRKATPERWAKAAARAVAERIEVRQVASTGQWVATSGTQANVCYLLEIVNGVVARCTCPAGEFGDPCCKHAARFYLDLGLLDPEPEPPAPASCPRCHGQGEYLVTTGFGGLDYYWRPCDCRGRAAA